MGIRKLKTKSYKQKFKIQNDLITLILHTSIIPYNTKIENVSLYLLDFWFVVPVSSYSKLKVGRAFTNFIFE